jgi:dihydroorotate dehydrogenase
MIKFVKNNAEIFLVLLSSLGLMDALYLTYEHYYPLTLVCPNWGIIDCGKVVNGPYSTIFGLPLGLYGSFFYITVFATIILIRKFKEQYVWKYFAIIISSFAFLFSIYLVFVQIFIIGAICIYCCFSALTSTLIFFITIDHWEEERKRLVIWKIGMIYRTILKKIFFLIDAEVVHENMLSFGEISGRISWVKRFTNWLLVKEDKTLRQAIAGLDFKFPVGMAAGFDYEAKLTQFLPNLGFGFATVGTITNISYEGNPHPRLGRLPNSRSLLVNKGFKNDGAKAIAEKMAKLKFDYAQGVSIGRSNNEKLITQKMSIADVVSAFQTFEKYKVKNSYYELNISCPNLIHGKVDFYEQQKLNELLNAIDKLHLKKPVFIKMPIERTDKEVITMLNIIIKHNIAGVIFGNLQKDKDHPSLDKAEVNKFKMGYFSGKPTFERSNELIKLAYKNFDKKLIIIGCGGIFSAEDAYTKIKLGASLVQLITGLIYQGPQLASEINSRLSDLLKKDGFKNVSEAVGIDVK